MRSGTVRCWLEGARRVDGARAIVLGIWGLSLLLALPLGFVLRGLLRDHLGGSLAAEAAAEGVNYDWWNDFLSQAGGLGTTFVPSIIGFAAPLRNLSDIADAAPLAATLTVMVGAWLAIWAFLAGGIFDRYARARRVHAPAFFAACGVFFFRFLRLGAAAFLAYWFLFGVVHGWLFERWYPRWTHEFSVERNAFLVRLALYLLFAALLAAVNLVFDYAKIRAVVEDRRSMLGALASALRFIRQNLAAAVGLYLLNTLAFIVLLALYRAVAPGAGWSGAGVLVAFAVTQVFILARVWLKLVFAASQIALFQGRLAHAGYAAFPEREPLEPPVVEALGAPAVPAPPVP